MIRSYQELSPEKSLDLLRFDADDFDDSMRSDKADQLKAYLQSIQNYGSRFSDQIASLAMPLRLSVLSLVCSKRVHFLNPELLELVSNLISFGFTYERQAEFQDK
mmetsp:Transcript_19299/g.29604  ORF Transcript_19299/g.29604 Transcript_19299/m.29604 type:complete len:105 (-) Transcript_19299:2066-2380(-)